MNIFWICFYSVTKITKMILSTKDDIVSEYDHIHSHYAYLELCKHYYLTLLYNSRSTSCSSLEFQFDQIKNDLIIFRY